MTRVMLLSLHPATRASMDLQGYNSETGWGCGCCRIGDLAVRLCSYHEGYDDGADAADRMRTGG